MSSAAEARVGASPELATLLAEQERSLALTRSAAQTVEAPRALRARVVGQSVFHDAIEISPVLPFLT